MSNQYFCLDRISVLNSYLSIDYKKYLGENPGVFYYLYPDESYHLLLVDMALPKIKKNEK